MQTYRHTRGSSTNERNVPRLPSFASSSSSSSLPPLLVTVPLTIVPSIVDIASLDGQSVHTLTNDSRHSRATPPRCARYSWRRVCAGACSRRLALRSFVLPSGAYIRRVSDTWKVSKGTSVRKRLRTDKREAQGRAQHPNPPDLLQQRGPTPSSTHPPNYRRRLSDYCCKCRV